MCLAGLPVLTFCRIPEGLQPQLQPRPASAAQRLLFAMQQQHEEVWLLKVCAARHSPSDPATHRTLSVIADFTHYFLCRCQSSWVKGGKLHARQQSLLDPLLLCQILAAFKSLMQPHR